MADINPDSAEETPIPNPAPKAKRGRKARQPVAGRWIVQVKCEVNDQIGVGTWCDLSTCDGKREAESWLRDNGLNGQEYRFATASKTFKATEKKHVELTPVD
jgi:hypothetical protein